MEQKKLAELMASGYKEFKWRGNRMKIQQDFPSFSIYSLKELNLVLR
jgi:hypothetical protein